jgi:hypothetical protein
LTASSRPRSEVGLPSTATRILWYMMTSVIDMLAASHARRSRENSGSITW